MLFILSLLLSSRSVSQARSPAGLDYFPSSNDRIMSDMFKEVALAGRAEEAGSETHTCERTHAHTCRCTHIPDASIDSVTLCSGAGFDDVSVCQAEAEINLCVEDGEMRQGGFRMSSVIITDVRQDDSRGLTLLVNR